MSAASCANCGTRRGDGEFCSGCGQRNRHGMLRARELTSDVFEQVMEWRLPWPRTMIDLCWRPGAVALDYVEGRRARYVNPVKYCFVIVAVAMAASALLQSQRSGDSAGDAYIVDLPGNVLALLAVPVQVAVLRLAFWRSARTATEIAVLGLYVTAQTILIFQLVFSPTLGRLLDSLGGELLMTVTGSTLVGLVLAIGALAVREFFGARLPFAVGAAIASYLVSAATVFALHTLLAYGQGPMP